MSTEGTAGVAYVLTRSTDANSASDYIGIATFIREGSRKMGRSVSIPRAQSRLHSGAKSIGKCGGRRIPPKKAQHRVSGGERAREPR